MTKMKLGIWYFAHPFTVLKDGCHDVEAERENFELAAERAAELFKRGYNVFSPVTHSFPVQDELGHADEQQLPWYEIDKALIDACKWEGIILAPGWKDSHGCRLEWAIFFDKAAKVLDYEALLEAEDGAEPDSEANQEKPEKI